MNFEQRIGAFALPGNRPGCITIVGIERVAGDMHIVDEYESHSTNEIITRLFVLEDRHRPNGWFGDNRNQTVRHLLTELNQERGGLDNHCMKRREIYPGRSSLLEESEPYQHLCGILQPLLGQDTKRLHLHESKAELFLSQLQPEEFHTLGWGEFPSVESLAMAAFELINWQKQEVHNRSYTALDRERQQFEENYDNDPMGMGISYPVPDRA